MRLVHDNGAAPGGTPDPKIVRLLVKARRWWARLREGEIDVTRPGELEGVQPAYITRVVRLAFLSPVVMDALLAGRAAAHVDASLLVSTGAIPPSWKTQADMLLSAKIVQAA